MKSERTEQASPTTLVRLLGLFLFSSIRRLVIWILDSSFHCWHMFRVFLFDLQFILLGNILYILFLFLLRLSLGLLRLILLPVFWCDNHGNVIVSGLAEGVYACIQCHIHAHKLGCRSPAATQSTCRE